MQIQKAVAVAVALPADNIQEINISLDELKSLADTAGISVEKEFIQRREKIVPATYIGRGKIEQIKNFIIDSNIKIVLFDKELSPTQISKLENIFNARIIDRTSLILEIFAQRAKTSEAKLQVELAQLIYQLPRLKQKKEIEFSQQAGVKGLKGPGEKRLELNRRTIQNRITILKKKLKKVKETRSIQRNNRKDFISIVLIGYTNSGKSSLLKTLTKEDVFIENKLFATLDPKTCRLTQLFNKKVVITDTVGFIKNLPHSLIESFKATLEEVRAADILINVVDVSKNNYKSDIESVYSVLKELKVDDKPIITALNKIDKIEKKHLLNQAMQIFPNPVLISATEKLNIDKFIEKINYVIDRNFFIQRSSEKMSVN